LSIGLIGTKSGMSRLFTEEGQSIPVTAISIAGNFISDIKTSERDGYEALVVSKIKKSNNRNKSQVEYFKKRDIQPGILAEFKTKDIDDHQIGSHLTGTSKGKGYAGVIKRHNFKMQDATHGNSLAHRAHGSIGQCQTPGRVWKGKKMSGHMGNVQKTIQSLEIVELDKENNLIFVKGSIPGFNGSAVKIKPSIKKS
jgi:large subunit ribosomal protein L3